MEKEFSNSICVCAPKQPLLLTVPHRSIILASPGMVTGTHHLILLIICGFTHCFFIFTVTEVLYTLVKPSQN